MLHLLAKLSAEHAIPDSHACWAGTSQTKVIKFRVQQSQWNRPLARSITVEDCPICQLCLPFHVFCIVGWQANQSHRNVELCNQGCSLSQSYDKQTCKACCKTYALNALSPREQQRRQGFVQLKHSACFESASAVHLSAWLPCNRYMCNICGCWAGGVMFVLSKPIQVQLLTCNSTSCLPDDVCISK